MSREDSRFQLDHVVVNAKTDLNGIEREFRTLGFSLSPRGFHSLGSINHVATFRENYLELIGLPPQQPDARPEISQGTTGIDAVVFRTPDAYRTRKDLERCGFSPTPVQEFTRPVVLGGTKTEARFRTVRLPRSTSVGRVYFCQHLTPQLVWSKKPIQHRNGSRRIIGVVAVTPTPKQQANIFGRLLHSDVRLEDDSAIIPIDKNSVLEVMTPKRYGQQYGESALKPPVQGEAEYFGAIVLQSNDLSDAANCTKPRGWQSRQAKHGAIQLSSQQRHVLVVLDTPDIRE